MFYEWNRKLSETTVAASRSMALTSNTYQDEGALPDPFSVFPGGLAPTSFPVERARQASASFTDGLFIEHVL